MFLSRDKQWITNMFWGRWWVFDRAKFACNNDPNLLFVTPLNLFKRISENISCRQEGKTSIWFLFPISVLFTVSMTTSKVLAAPCIYMQCNIYQDWEITNEITKHASKKRKKFIEDLLLQVLTQLYHASVLGVLNHRQQLLGNHRWKKLLLRQILNLGRQKISHQVGWAKIRARVLEPSCIGPPGNKTHLTRK